MASPAIGAGFLLVADRLTDAAFCLIQPSVNTTVPSGGISTGAQTVAAWDSSMYVGAQIVVGNRGGSDIEVVMITAVVVGTSFTATFQNAHTAGETIFGPTFPVRQASGDQLFTQAEMIGYLSTALSDFLTDCPLIYAIASVTVPPLQQSTALPADSMFPVRVAYNNYPLRETSQTNLDINQYLWTQYQINEPYTWFRDKLPLQNVGIWPRAGKNTSLSVIYAQRSAQTLGLADGFPIPDPFTLGVLYRTLAFAYSKDGEMRQPALAKFFMQRYEIFVRVSKMWLDAMSDPNLELAAQ